MPARLGGVAGFIVYAISSCCQRNEKTVVFILEIVLLACVFCWEWLYMRLLVGWI